jgi:hypothetical protein
MSTKPPPSPERSSARALGWLKRIPFDSLINFDKTEVVILGYSPEDQKRIADSLNCRLSSFPITYLGRYEDSHQGS